MQQAAEKRLGEAEKLQAERDIQYNQRFNRVLGLVEKLAVTAENHEQRIQRQENR
jgi:hypothetical protein